MPRDRLLLLSSLCLPRRCRCTILLVLLLGLECESGESGLLFLNLGRVQLVLPLLGLVVLLSLLSLTQPVLLLE